MPEYPYEDTTTGERVDLFQTMAETPPIGAVIEHEGRTLRKLAPGGVRAVDAAFVPFTSISQPRWDPAAPRHDRDGRPQFASRREVETYMARKNERNPKQLVWDQ